MAGREPSISRRRILGAAASLPLAALAGPGSALPSLADAGLVGAAARRVPPPRGARGAGGGEGLVPGGERPLLSRMRGDRRPLRRRGGRGAVEGGSPAAQSGVPAGGPRGGLLLAPLHRADAGSGRRSDPHARAGRRCCSGEDRHRPHARADEPDAMARPPLEVLDADLARLTGGGRGIGDRPAARRAAIDPGTA
jgi:hypothetical protein